MSTVRADVVRAESDLCLILARAFLPPTWEGALAALAGDLPDDLRDGTALLGIEASHALERFETAMAGIADRGALLVIYSHLFLAPPVPAPLNAGLYLDGALDGRSVVMMEACYRRHGVERGPHFKDLSDHLSVQLEFLAFLLAAAADQAGQAAAAEVADAAAFASAFVAPWLADLAERTARAAAARGGADPYTPLMSILSPLIESIAAAGSQAPAASRIAAG